MTMRMLSPILLAVFLIGCRTEQSGALPSSATSLVGSYYRGDGLGYNLYLDLRADGKYNAQWKGCLGLYGEARGTWTVIDDKVVFTPRKETGMMKDHLKELHIVQHAGQTVFVSDLHDDYYEKYGPDERIAFHRQSKM